MKDRDALKEEATKSGDEELFAEYKVKRNEVKSRLKNEEAEFYKNKFHDSNITIKKAWKTVYDILGQVERSY